jgi:hypothetical protein
MRPGLRPSVHGAGLLFAAALLSAGCEQGRLREGGELSQTPLVQPAAMRGLVTARGLESLYRTATPEGIEVHAEVMKLAHPTLELSLGPIDETLPIERWSVITATPRMNVRATIARPAFAVALRLHDGVSFQICRFGLTLTNTVIDGSVEIRSTDDGPILDIAAPAIVEVDQVQVRVIGSCPLGLDATLGDDSTLRGAIEAYVFDALIASAERAFAASPLDMMGLIRRRAELARVSPYDNRRGHVLLIGRLSETEPSTISNQGLEVSLDLALSPQRAGCAPPVGLAVPDTRPASSLVATSLNQFGADVGLALSVSAIERLAQSMTLAGFMCQGFDDGKRDEESREAIAVDRLRLEDIGLGGLSLGPWARVVLGATDLPTAEMRPERGDVLLRLPGFTVDLYGELLGVPVRLASTRSTVELGLRPRAAGAGLIGFDVETLQARDVRLSSDWFAAEPASEDGLNWTRRLLLMTLQDRLILPLPIEPGTPLTLVGSQIRSSDVVLMMRFAP